MAGRDWDVLTRGQAGPEMMAPLLVARDDAPLEVCHGVVVAPHACMAMCPPVDIICVPEVNLPPSEPLGERYQQEITWLKQRYGQGAILASACSGSMLFAEAGLLDGLEATTHWAWCGLPSIIRNPVRCRT